MSTGHLQVTGSHPPRSLKTVGASFCRPWHELVEARHAAKEHGSSESEIKPERLTPWADNEGTGQLSVFDSRPDLQALPANASFAKFCPAISIKTYCHGEVRIALTPRYEARGKDLKRVAGCHVIGRSSVAPSVRIDKGRIPRISAATKNLVCRPAVQDDSRVRYGWGALKPFSLRTRYSAILMEEAAHVAWQLYGKTGLFLTATLACSTEMGFRTVAAYSGYLVHLVKQWLRDRLGTDCAVFGAWEYQKRGALHLHLCVQGHDIDALTRIKADFHGYWRRLNLDLSDSTGVDLFEKSEGKTWRDDDRFPRTDAGWLRSNAGRYLAKYIGKEAQRTQQSARYRPSSWVTVDRKSSRLAASQRIRILIGGIDPATARKMFADGESLAEGLARNGYKYGNPIFAEDETWLIRFEDDEFLEYIDILLTAFAYRLDAVKAAS